MIPLPWLDRFSDEEEYLDDKLEYTREEYHDDERGEGERDESDLFL